VPGDEEFSYQWKEAEWWFSSAAHRDAFAEDPERYAPQYGGFCAYAASQG
jgi:YHS domain-containing protein